MDCLALDIATTTGWAFARFGEPPVFGSMTFAGDLGEFIYQFDAWLTTQVSGFKVTHVAVEQPIVMIGKTNFSTTCRLVGAYAVAMKVARDCDVPILSATPGEWRRHFIGCGRAPASVPRA